MLWRILYKDYKEGERQYLSEAVVLINGGIQRRLRIIKDHKTTAHRKEISVAFDKKLMMAQIASQEIGVVTSCTRAWCTQRPANTSESSSTPTMAITTASARA